MKFKNILIIGNLNSGKTSISRKLTISLSLETVSIDDLRRQYGDGSFSKEYLAWSKFFELIESEKPIIIEFSGAGMHKHPVKELLNRSNINWLIIYVSASYNDIIKRMENTKLETPYPWKISGFDNLKLIHNELENDWTNKFWLNSNISAIKIDNTLSLDETYNKTLFKINSLSDE